MRNFIKFFFIFAYLLLISPDMAFCKNVVVGDSPDGLIIEVVPSQYLDFTSQILENYEKRTSQWIPKLQDITFQLFGYFITIEIILFGIAAGLSIGNGGKHLGLVLGEFALMVFLPAALMYVLIHFYPTWSKEIVEWLQFTVAGYAEPASNIGETSFFRAGLNLAGIFWGGVELTIPATWILLIAGFITLVCYALMAMQIILVKAESYIVMSAGIIMLGFGAFSQTRSYAINFLQYVLSVAVKLFVLQLMIGIAFNFVEDFLLTSQDIEDVAIIIGGSIILLALIRCIPDICAGIISGQHSGGSANAITGAISNITGAVTAGAAAVGAAASTVIAGKDTKDALSTLSKAANEAGLSGTSKGMFMAKGIGAGLMNGAFGVNSESASKTSMGRFNSALHNAALDADKFKKK